MIKLSRDWSKISCKNCKYRKKCRKKSVAKGSKMCMERLNGGFRVYNPQDKQKQVSEQKKLSALLWNLVGKEKR